MMKTWLKRIASAVCAAAMCAAIFTDRGICRGTGNQSFNESL